MHPTQSAIYVSLGVTVGDYARLAALMHPTQTSEHALSWVSSAPSSTALGLTRVLLEREAGEQLSTELSCTSILSQ